MTIPFLSKVAGFFIKKEEVIPSELVLVNDISSDEKEFILPNAEMLMEQTNQLNDFRMNYAFENFISRFNEQIKIEAQKGHFDAAYWHPTLYSEPYKSGDSHYENQIPKSDKRFHIVLNTARDYYKSKNYDVYIGPSLSSFSVSWSEHSVAKALENTQKDGIGHEEN